MSARMPHSMRLRLLQSLVTCIGQGTNVAVMEAFRALQTFLQADDATMVFLLSYVAMLVVLFAANFAYKKAFVSQRPTAAKGSSPIQKSAKSAASGFAVWIASQRITPNQITVIGLVLVIINCGLYLWHRDPFMLGTGLIAAYLFDTLDGVVARAQGTSSRFGGYLDAVIDRYQEVVTLLVIGWVTELWLPVLLFLSGSLLTSYNKARVAVELPIDNKGWPDLLAKPTRTFFLCTVLIGGNSVPWFLPLGLWLLAIMTNVTALHRIIRAHFLLVSPSEDRTAR